MIDIDTRAQMGIVELRKDRPSSEVIPLVGERAISLREAAALLRVSYGTVYARRKELGFFQIGSVWRIWPEKLRQVTQDYNERRPARTEQEKTCPSESAVTGSITSISERQAAQDFAARVARRTGRLHRNTTTR